MPKSKKHRSKKEKKLTPRQEAFVEEYLTDLNATQAYIRSYSRKGYTPSIKVAEVGGLRNLANPIVKKGIQKARQKLIQRTQVDQERVITELARIAFMDPREFFNEDGKLKDVHKLPDDAAAALAGMDININPLGEVTKKIKLTRKEKALELLAKHLGMFEEKLTLNFSSEVLDAVLSGLPEEFAGRVRKTLGELVSGKRN